MELNKGLLQNSDLNNLENLQSNFVNLPNTQQPQNSEDAIKAMFQGSASGVKPGMFDGDRTPFTELPTNGRYPTYFNGVDTEDAFGHTQTWYNKWGNAAVKFGGLATTTAINGTVGLIYGVGKAISDGKFSSFYDNEFSKALDKINSDLENSMPNYYTQQETDAEWYSPENWFTANFWADKVFKNLGFAAGAYLSGMGIGAGVRGLGQVFSKIPGIAKVASAGGFAEVAAASETAMANVPKGSRMAAMGKSFEDIAANYASKYNVLNKTQRAVTAGLATFGEASLEAQMMMNDYRQDLINDYYNETGLLPSGDDMKDINQTVEGAGNTLFGLNVGLLSVTNYIQFPKVLGSSFTGEKKLISDALSKNMRNVTLKEGKETVEGLARTSANQVYQTAKATTKFGRIMNKVGGFSRFVFSPSEAFEEGAQSVFSVGVENYYNRKHDEGDASVIEDLFGKGAKELITSKEGIESILIGGFSGAIAEARGNVRNRTQLNKNTKEAVTRFNQRYVGSYLKANIDSVKRGQSIMQDTQEAAKANDELQVKDLLHDYAFNYLMPRIQFGRKGLVDNDIATYREMAQSEEGIKQLKDDGIIANDTATKEQFMAKLDTMQQMADTMFNQYEALTLRYANMTDKAGNQLYTPEVIEKMMYSSAKVDDYSNRITSLSTKLAKAGFDVEPLMNSIEDKPSEVSNILKEMYKSIAQMPVISEIKDTLRKDIGDTAEMYARRKENLKEYEDIKKNPKGYQSGTQEELAKDKPVAPGPQNPTVQVMTRDGSENLEVGVEYYAGTDMAPATFDGKPTNRGFKKFHRFTVLGEKNNKIQIRTEDGREFDMPKERFRRFKLGKVADVQNNKKAKFYLENVNTPFVFNFGKNKGGEKTGFIEYSPKQGILLFKYRDSKGNIRTKEVTNKDFVAQPGFDKALIRPAEGHEFSEASWDYVRNFNDEQRRTVLIQGKVAVLSKLVEDKKAKLKEVEDRLIDEEIALEKAQKDYSEMRDEIEAAQDADTKTGKMKKAFKKLIATAQQMANFIQTTEANVTQLSQMSDELRDEIDDLDDTMTNAAALPDGMALIQMLKDNKANLESVILDTGIKINSLSGLIDKAKKFLTDTVATIKDLLGGFNTQYGTEDIFDAEADPNNDQFNDDLVAIRQMVSQAETVEIPSKTAWIKHLDGEIDTLRETLKQTEKELKRNNEVLDAFIEAARAYRKAEMRRRLFGSNEVQRELSAIQKGLQSQSSEDATDNPETDYEKIRQEFEDKAKDVSYVYASSVSPEYHTDVDTDFSKQYDYWYKREAEFLNNVDTPDFQEKTPRADLKIIPVSRANQEAIGLPGFISESYVSGGETISNDTNVERGAIALVYVAKNEDDTYDFLDKNGNRIGKVGEAGVSYNQMVFTYLENAVPERTGLVNTGATKFTNKQSFDDAQVTEITNKAKQSRKNLLESQVAVPYDFNISRGLPNQSIVDKKVVVRNNSIIESGIAQQSELSTPMIVIPTSKNTTEVNDKKTGNIVINDRTVRFPLGRPVLVKGSNVAFLNNRKFTTEDAEKFYNILKVAAKQMVESFVENGRMIVDPIYTQYLSRVLHFNYRSQGEPSRNQIFFDTAGNLVVGKNKITVTPENIEASKELIMTFLEEGFHNVNNYALTQKASDPFVEIVSIDDNGNMKTVTWKSYQHYLLSPTYDLAELSDEFDDLQGKARKGATPLTTNIIVPQEEDGVIEPPFVQKYVTLKEYADFRPTPKKKKVPVQAPTEQAPKKEAGPLTYTAKHPRTGEVLGEVVLDGATENTIVTPDGKSIFFTADISDGLKFVISDTTEVPEEQAVKMLSAVIKKSEIEALAIAEAAEEITEIISKEQEVADSQKTNAEISQQSYDRIKQLKEKANNSPASGQTYHRVALPGRVKVEDIPGFTAWMKEVLPQVNIKVVNNLIQMTGGGFAWGAYRDGYVYLYENAEIGTGYHEAFEAVWNSFLTPAEQDELLKEFRAREGEFYDREAKVNVAYSAANNGQAKEAIAEEFRDYKMNQTKKKTPKIISFFRRLMDFIKNFVFGNQSAIQEVFRKIDSAQYKSMAISQKPMNEMSYRSAELNGVSETWLHEVMQGMTAKVFSKIFFEDGNIIKLAEGKLTIAEVYDTLKEELTQLYEVDLMRDDSNLSDEEKILLLEGLGNFKGWDFVKNNWNTFVLEHAKYLKPFKIAFRKPTRTEKDAQDDEASHIQDEQENTTEEGTIKVEYTDNVNGRDYDRDILKIDAKQSAPTSVKILFSTLMKTFYPNVENANLEVPEVSLGAMHLPYVADYTENFYKTLDALSGATGLNMMQRKLKDLAKFTPDLVRLYNRLFKKDSTARNDNEWKLLLQFENAMSKQKPNYRIQMFNEDGTSYSVDANSNRDVDMVIEQWTGNLRAKLAKNGLVDYSSVSGSYIINANRIKSEPVDDKSTLTFLQELGFPIKDKQMKVLAKMDSKRNTTYVKELIAAASGLHNQIKSGDGQVATHKRAIGAVGRINKIAELIVRSTGTKLSSQHFNIESEPVQNYILPNYVSLVLNRINDATKLKDLFAKVPYYLNDVWCSNSLLLSEQGFLFNQQGRTKELTPVIVEGSKSQADAHPTSKLNFVLRQIQEFNKNLTGIYYNLIPADAKTEWGLNMGHYISKGVFTSAAYKAQVQNIFKKYLETEIDLIKDAASRYDIGQLRANNNLKKLRFFKDILSPELVNKIHGYANGEEQTSTKDFIKSIEEQFKTDLWNWLGDKVKAQRAFFEANRIVEKTPSGYNTFFGLDKDFIEEVKYGQKNWQGYYEFANKEVDKVIEFRTVNYVIHNIELHKVFFGDPAQYKDASKRIKSFLSGREYTHIDDSDAQGYNSWANENLNKVGDIQLQPGMPGYHIFKDNMTAVTFEHGENGQHTVATNINEYKETLGSKAAPYEAVNEIDAQSYMLDTTYREFMRKSGGRWSDDMETQYQYEMAYARQAMDKKGKLKNYPEDLKVADKALVDAGNPQAAQFFVLKPVGAGTQMNDEMMVMNLLKTSSFPMFYRFIEGYKGLESLYEYMWQNNVGYTGPKSQHKVGAPANLPSLYDITTGNVDLNNTAPSYDVPWEHFGTQVETNAAKKAQTRGSQLTKLATLDLFDNSLPIDFMVNETSLDVKLAAWDQLDNAGKVKASRIYELYRDNNQALIELTNRGYDNILDKLGIEENGGQFVFADPEKAIKFLLSEMTKRDLPENVASALQTFYNPETQREELLYPLEALPNFKAIKNMIWSIADKEITRPKMSGGPKVQVSGAMWEKNNRQAVYKKGDKWETVTDYNSLTEEEQSTVRLTSSDLQFYKKGENGTIAMEVYLPHWFKGVTKSDDELMKYLNSPEGQKLLTGIGFRIPTQGTNSVEVFTVKGFLPQEMGDMVVVPSEITVKVGSDFDIDKLNMYLKNFTINGEGFPEVVDFISDTNSSKELRKLYNQLYGKQLTAIDAKGANLIDAIFSEDGVTEKIPTFEEFVAENKGKDPFKLNSKEAIENKYYETLEGILSLPQNYERLLTPNSSDEMTELEEEITKIKNPDQKKRTKGDIDYTTYLDPLWMARERHNFIAGKDGVGIGAVNNTGHAVSQLNTMYIDPEAKADLDFNDSKYVNDMEIKLDHPKVKIFGKEYTSLSSRKDKVGRFISDKISQYINGFVDVAKDAWIVRMLVYPELAGTAMFLERAGVPVKEVFYFLNQPIIQEYMKMNDVQRAVKGINPEVEQEFMDALINRAKEQFDSGDYKAKDGIFELKDMKNMLTRYSSGNELTIAENVMQKQILDEFIKYRIFANHMFQMSQATNWDTTRFNSGFLIDIKKIQLQSTRKGNIINSADKFMKDSFIDNIRNTWYKIQGAYSTLFKTELPQVKEALKPIIDLFARASMAKDTKVGILSKAELSLLDFMVQTTYKENGQALNQFLDQYLLNGATAISNNLVAAKQSAKGDLADNLALNGMIAVTEGNVNDVKNIKLFEKPRDAYSANFMTGALRELKLADPKLYGELVKVGILQSGVRPSTLSYNQYLPNEDYIKYIKPAIDAISREAEELQAFTTTNAFYRNNWRDDKIVPKVKMKFDDYNMEYYYPYYNNDNLKSISDKGYSYVYLHELSKNSKFPVVKIVEIGIDPNTGEKYTQSRRREMQRNGDYSYQTVKIFQRVEQNMMDEETGDITKEPFYISLKYGRGALYKQINAWGDGFNMQEYYTTAKPSILKKNVKVSEVSDTDIINALTAGNVNSAKQIDAAKVMAAMEKNNQIQKKDC